MDAAARAREDAYERQLDDELGHTTTIAEDDLPNKVHYIARAAARGFSCYDMWTMEQVVFTKGSPDSWGALRRPQTVRLIQLTIPSLQNHFLASDGFVYCRHWFTKQLYRAQLGRRYPGEVLPVLNALQDLIDTKAYRPVASI